MATTTYNDTSVPTRTINMFWVGLIALVVAVLVAFFAMGNRSGDMGRPQAPPPNQMNQPVPEPTPGP